jgi:hypothetical protein
MAATRSLQHSTDSSSVSRARMITHHARQIFSAYRKDEYADPDGFVMQLGAVLERYSDNVIATVCSPYTGIQRRLKTRPPNIGEVVEACDEEQERENRIIELSKTKLKLRGPRPPAERANVLLRTDALLYQAMCDKAADPKTDPADWRWDPDGKGIWVALGWLR